MKSNLYQQAYFQAGLSLRDWRSGMSFEESNNPKNLQISTNTIDSFMFY